jgi:preprotein translocase subunit SecA
MNALERFAVVHVLDGFWMKHMDDLEQLKQGIGLLGYGQQNPVVAYRGYAYDMLDVMLMKLRTSVVHKLFTAHSVVRNAVNALDA